MPGDRTEPQPNPRLINKDNYKVEDVTIMHIIETLVFVLLMANSKLKNSLQKANDQYTDQLNVPRPRFEKRSGPTINDELGRSSHRRVSRCGI